VYLRALSIRLPIACASNTGSPEISVAPVPRYEQRDALELCGRQIEVDRLPGDVGRIHGHETGAAHACIDLGQAQQRIENQDDPVNVDHGTVDLGKRLLGLGRVSDSLSRRERSSARGVRRSWLSSLETSRTPCNNLLNLVEHPIDGPLRACSARRLPASQEAMAPIAPDDLPVTVW